MLKPFGSLGKTETLGTFGTFGTNNLNISDYSNLSDCSDFVFMNETETQELFWELEGRCVNDSNGRDFVAHVKENMTGDDQLVYLYYGNDDPPPLPDFTNVWSDYEVVLHFH